MYNSSNALVDNTVKIVPPGLVDSGVSASSWLQANVRDNTTIHAPHGTIAVDAPMFFSGVSNVRFTGGGTYQATSQLSRAAFELTGGCDNWVFDGITWDANAAAMPDTEVLYDNRYNALVQTEGFSPRNSNLYFYSCRFLNLYTNGLYFYQSSGDHVIRDCYFHWAANRKQRFGICCTIVSPGTPCFLDWGNNFLDFDKPVDASGLFDAQWGMAGFGFSGVLSDQQSKIVNNTMRYVGRNNASGHRFGALDIYQNCRNMLFQGNDVVSNQQAMRLSRSTRVDAFDNTFKCFGPSPGETFVEIFAGSVQEVGSDRTRVERNSIEYIGNNPIYNPDEYGSATFNYSNVPQAIQFACDHNDFAIVNATCRGNIIQNCRTGIRGAGSIDGLVIEDNKIIDASTYITHGAWSAGSSGVPGGGALGTQANERMKDIIIRRNVCKLSAPVVYTAFTADNTTNTITSAGHGRSDGDRVFLKGGDLPDGLLEYTDYYVLNATTDTFQLELNIGAGVAAFSDDGTGTMEWTSQRDVGGGGLGFTNYPAFAGTSDTIYIEDNKVEGRSDRSGQGILTLNQDVVLRGNALKNYAIGLYCRGTSSNVIRKFANTFTGVAEQENFDGTLEKNILNEERNRAETLLLDTLSPEFVYSCNRRLMNAYGGSAMEIREDSGDTLLDVGFKLTGVDKDNVSMLAHVGANNGYARTIYDQSGNAHNLLQATTTKQAQLVNSGSLITINNSNMPLGVGGAAGTAYQSVNTFTMTDFTVFCVAQFSNSSQGVFNFDAGVDRIDLYWAGGTLYLRRKNQSASAAVPYNQLVQITGYNSDALKKLWVNGTLEDTNATSDPLAISGLSMWLYAVLASTFNMAGYIAELIIIPGAVPDSQRQEIESNQIEFYGVNV